MNKFCRVDGSELIPVNDFGLQPLGNGFLLPEQTSDEYFFSMQTGFSQSSLMFQLLDQPNPEQMFHENYAFFSSTSLQMSHHFKKFADGILESKFITDDPFIVELGCNDGIMLKHIASKSIRHLGIEPSVNTALEANKVGVNTLSEFFSSELATKVQSKHGQADVIFSANVMCHIPDINDIASGISDLLKKSGVLVFEDPYLGDVIKKTSYDQIYDEHVFLFSALSVSNLFSRYGLELINAEPQKTHGGSMRYTLAHKGVYPIEENVQTILQAELELGLDKAETYKAFDENVRKSKNDLVKLLSDIKSIGKSIAGYAATSKSTTILNYCGIGGDLIDYICDTTPLKHNTLSPGMHIPVVPYQDFLDRKPDYAFLFAWNHAEEILAKENTYLQGGGKFITHVPSVNVL